MKPLSDKPEERKPMDDQTEQRIRSYGHAMYRHGVYNYEQPFRDVPERTEALETAAIACTRLAPAHS